MARFFLALFALVLFGAVASASVEDNTVELSQDEQDEIRRGLAGTLLKVLAKYLGKEFVEKINIECVYEAAEECGVNIFSKHLYKCAEAFFKEHRDRCLKLQEYQL